MFYLHRLPAAAKTLVFVGHVINENFLSTVMGTMGVGRKLINIQYACSPCSKVRSVGPSFHVWILLLKKAFLLGLSIVWKRFFLINYSIGVANWLIDHEHGELSEEEAVVETHVREFHYATQEKLEK